MGFRIYFFEIVKKSYRWGFISLKMLNNVRLGASLKRLKINATGDLFHRKCWNKLTFRIYSIEKAKIRYGLVFISLWMPKYGKADDLFHWKGQNLVRLGIYFINKKCQRKVRLRIYFIENAEVRYGLGIYFIKNDKIRYGWKFILLKRNLLHWNC